MTKNDRKVGQNWHVRRGRRGNLPLRRRCGSYAVHLALGGTRRLPFDLRPTPARVSPNRLPSSMDLPSTLAQVIDPSADRNPGVAPVRSERHQWVHRDGLRLASCPWKRHRRRFGAAVRAGPCTVSARVGPAVPAGTARRRPVANASLEQRPHRASRTSPAGAGLILVERPPRRMGRPARRSTRSQHPTGGQS